MKLSNTMLMVAAMASSASAAKSVSGKNVAKVLRHARRVEDANANGDAAAEDEYAYLTKYSLKLIGCKAGESVTNADGETEYNAAIVRLCPTESGCDSDSTLGCKNGQGDFVVGLNTFIEQFLEDQKENMEQNQNGDDNFDMNRLAECSEYQVEGDDDNKVQYFIGPTCTADGTDVKMAVFDDEICTYESETSFDTISNGWTLPYSSGGMVSTACFDCLAYDENAAAYDLRDMCMNVHENAAYKCEANMEYYSYYGQNVEGCDTIQEMLPKAKKGNGGKVFGWIVFLAIVGGMAGYVMWWRKKKAAAASDGVVA